MRHGIRTETHPALRRARGTRPIDDRAFRKGKLAIVDAPNSSQAELPERCICCGAESDQNKPMTKQLVWMPSAYYVLLVLGLLPLLIVYLITRKQLKLTWWLCPVHRQKRGKVKLTAVLLGVSFLPLIIAGGVTNTPALAIIGVVAFLAFIIALVVLGQYDVRITNFKDDQFFIGGLNKAYLETLPEEA